MAVSGTNPRPSAKIPTERKQSTKGKLDIESFHTQNRNLNNFRTLKGLPHLQPIDQGKN